ncbi:MAG: tyrosine-type recombinase/integrase, partial [Chloroflexi bacterium]|nr:tyrosine-type recombinase/integrase [Chloroflexota bacterium]
MQRIANFINYLSAEKGASPHTIQAYQNDLRQLAAFLADDATPDQVDWGAVRKTHLVDYAVYLREREYSTSTVARKLASVRSFFHFLAAEGVCREDPSLSLTAPRVARRLPHVLSVDQVAQLLAQPLRLPRGVALRDALMFHLVFDGGIHVGDVVAMDVSDADPESGRLSYGATDEQRRMVLLGEKAATALREYVQHLRPEFLPAGADEPALFVNENGNRFTDAGFGILASRHAEAKRDRAILELLYATGMRASELVALNEKDVNLAAGYVRCLGKGRKERIIPVHQSAIEILELYLQQARPQLLDKTSTDDGALFLNNRGGRLTRQGLWL